MSGPLHPHKFIESRRKAIIESIGNRIPYLIAAEANGICEETLYAWLRQGRKDQIAEIDSDYARFSEAVRQIEQLRIKEHLDNIAFSPKGHDGSQWILEKRWYKHFSARAADIEMDERLRKLENRNGDSTNEGKEELDSRSNQA